MLTASLDFPCRQTPRRIESLALDGVKYELSMEQELRRVPEDVGFPSSSASHYQATGPIYTFSKSRYRLHSEEARDRSNS